VTTPDTQAGDGPAAPAYLALLDVLRCPHCRGPFVTPTEAAPGELVCSSCGRAYPVRGGIPVLLVDEARLPEIPDSPGGPDSPESAESPESAGRG
jgi:uncharacterized protein YbaR (Trm112 family)